MTLRIREVREAKDWNRFVLSLNPNTFLHSWQWGQVQQQAGEAVRYLGVEDENGAWIGAVLLLTVNAKRGRHWFCPHGPLLTDNQLLAPTLTVLIQYLKPSVAAEGVCALRVAPLVVDTPAVRQVFQRLGFKNAPLHVHSELTWVLDLDADQGKIVAGMRKTTRHAIQKAEQRGVTTEIFEGLAGLDRFIPLYLATKNRHKFVPFSRDFLAAQLEIFGADNAIYTIIARYQSRDVAAGIFIHFGETVFYHHGASTPTADNVPAPHLVQWRAVQEAQRRGARRYNFWGIAPDDKPHHPFAGITVFKKGFGGSSMNYLHAQDLPLTAAYARLWLVETVRKIRRGF